MGTCPARSTSTWTPTSPRRRDRAAGTRCPTPADLQRVLRAAGVRDGVPVVVYDEDNGSIAARLWWLLRWAGHDRVACSTAGTQRWAAEGHAGDDGRPGTGPGRHDGPSWRACRWWTPTGRPSWRVPACCSTPRAPERYRGDVEPIDPRAGHVPGARQRAVRRPHRARAAAGARPSELAEHFAEARSDRTAR